jgi:hypothetical protein
MEIVAQHLRGLTPGRLYGADGALMVPETSLREIAAVADHYLGEIQGSIWRPLQRDADRLLPALGARLREVRTAAIEETHGFLLDVDLMIGTGYAERAGVNFDPVPPVAKAVSPDANLRAPTEAEIALATERSRREDGTVDAFALLLELGDLTDDQQRGSA